MQRLKTSHDLLMRLYHLIVAPTDDWSIDDQTN